MPNNSNAIVRTCPLYWESLAHHSRLVPRIAEFVKFKAANPFSNFGSRDSATHHNFSHLKVRHAHLTSDISIWYRVHGKNPTLIDLYGLYSHDDSGTGQPANQRRQKNFIQRMSNTSFEPSDISEAQQILTAETRQQLLKWLVQSWGKKPWDQLKSLVNHAAYPCNVLSMMIHLREALPQLARAEQNIHTVEDPELQNQLGQVTKNLHDVMKHMWPLLKNPAEQGDELSAQQAKTQYQTQALPLVSELIHTLRAVMIKS